ncbi:MAG: cytochrome c [Burkholderiaceae bacterium]
MNTSTLKSVCRALAGAFALGSLLAAPVHAADIAAGKEKAAVCAACHGEDGKTPIDPSYAILAGQHRDYLVVALKAYRSGGRKNAIMAGQAAALSNDDINNLAAYYASLDGPLKMRR